ncbi:putative Spermine synthase [Candidatus Sulfotelmatomonas gaucii]|uniref:Polyamine aminopropyltransferase n=1 Tax=Candidatus Sulfuritelmatomonas gaucii TaxID=2043161 RepID=A0A2N9L4R0_9BACT|nr:putative Spermine synthase [Candidatus Sulfotelmatomonas gaucii]
MNPARQKLGPAALNVSALGAQAALTLCGYTAVVGQIVLMRELIQVFNGNEIALGILLATWLFWTGAGSGMASLWRLERNRSHLAVAVLECLLAASFPATIWALRGAKAFFQAVPGELVGPVPMLLTSLACLCLFCAASGALFVAAARMAESEGAFSPRTAASRAYLLEAAGSALGGVMASVLFVRFLESFQISFIVGLLNFFVALALVLRPQRVRVAALAVVAALAAIPLLIWVAPKWDAASRAQLWHGFNVLAAHQTIYGNLTVTQTTEAGSGEIRSIWENGTILANAPDPAAAEEAVHFALLEHPAPRGVLLIGGGVNGGVAEALKHPTVERLDYVELDPALIAMAREFFPAQTAVFYTDPRVHLHFLDGRRFLATTANTFDVIIVDVPDPQTAQLNRFYTVEFFRLARAHLAPRGLLSVELRSSEEMISPDLGALLQSIRRTMGEVFPYQAAIPGEIIHFFGATQPGVLTSDPQLLVARLRERNLATQYVREYFIPYRMMPDRMGQVKTELAPVATTPVNRDFAPIAYAFDVLLWSAQFKSGYAAWFRAAEHVSFAGVAGALGFALLLGAALLAFLPGRDRRKRAAAGSCVAATGFTLMALQIFLLLSFQAVYGYVYTELAILIGLFMAGIALGSWLAMRRAIQKVHPIAGFVSGHEFTRAANVAEMKRALAPARKRSLATPQLLLALAAPAMLFVVSMFENLASVAATWIAVQIVFPTLAVFAGSLGGYQFVIAAGIFLRNPAERTGLGLLYAIDLLGGCVGALALSTFLIPVLGFWRTAWLVAGINATALLLALFFFYKQEIIDP